MESTSPAAIEPPATVLLAHSRRCETAACSELRGDGGAHLRVTFADERPDPPDAVDGKLGLLTVGDVLARDGADEREFARPVVADSVADPTDLAAIGVAVSRFCDHWGDAELSVCFDSLDALLGHASPTTVFRFVHLLAARFSSVDACAHCHVDPARHEDRVVAALGTLFDAVVADDCEDALPEASDEEVAARLADEAPAVGCEAAPVTEATDEDVAAVLGD